MGKYTLTIQELITNNVNLFDFEYSFYNESHKKGFEKKFVDRFLFDEIIKLGYDYNYANIILFYDKYVEIALQSKISKEFRNVLLPNSKRKFDSFIALKMKLELKY